MTEREKQNEELKRDLRACAADFYRVTERICKYIDDTEELMKFHEKNTRTIAVQLDAERVIG